MTGACVLIWMGQHRNGGLFLGGTGGGQSAGIIIGSKGQLFFTLPGATGLNPGAVQVDDPARVFRFFNDTAEQAAQAFYGIALLL